MSYQNKLRNIRTSTNIIRCSYSIEYKNQYIHGASYNGVHICYAEIQNKLVFSKSLGTIKRKIRESLR